MYCNQPAVRPWQCPASVLCPLIYGEYCRNQKIHPHPCFPTMNRERCFPFKCWFLQCLGSFAFLPPWVLLALHYPLPLLMFSWGSCQSTCPSPSHGKSPPLGSRSNSCLTSYCPIFPLEKCSLLPSWVSSHLFCASVIPLEELSLRSLTTSLVQWTWPFASWYHNSWIFYYALTCFFTSCVPFILFCLVLKCWVSSVFPSRPSFIDAEILGSEIHLPGLSLLCLWLSSQFWSAPGLSPEFHFLVTLLPLDEFNQPHFFK